MMMKSWGAFEGMTKGLKRALFGDFNVELTGSALLRSPG